MHKVKTVKADHHNLMRAGKPKMAAIPIEGRQPRQGHVLHHCDTKYA